MSLIPTTTGMWHCNNPFVNGLFKYNRYFLTSLSGLSLSEKVIEIVKRIILAVSAPLVYVGLGFMALFSYPIANWRTVEIKTKSKNRIFDQTHQKPNNDSKTVFSKHSIEIAEMEEELETSPGLISLKRCGVKTAKDAIQYITNNKLTGADLSGFFDLDESDLETLFENCPKLTQLKFCSANIKSLPAKAGTLKELDCSLCVNLQRLPELPHVQKLNCNECKNLQHLPEKLPQGKELHCSWCINLQNLPELPQVEKLNCVYCKILQSLPELPQLKELNCGSCEKLQNLPELLHAEKLDCRGCKNLQHLPNLPQLQSLNCSDCENLQSLPELFQVKELNCGWCDNLHSLPSLPRLQKLYCIDCKNLLHLPELPQVKELNCSWCLNLQSLPKLPQAEKLNCNFCPGLQQLPVLPQIKELSWIT